MKFKTFQNTVGSGMSGPAYFCNLLCTLNEDVAWQVEKQKASPNSVPIQEREPSSAFQGRQGSKGSVGNINVSTGPE